METEEKKNEDSKEENENPPSGENTTLAPTNADAPSAEPTIPELPQVECREKVRLITMDRSQWTDFQRVGLNLEKGFGMYSSYLHSVIKMAKSVWVFCI